VIDVGTALLNVIVMSPVYQLGLGDVAWPSMTPTLTACAPVT